MALEKLNARQRGRLVRDMTFGYEFFPRGTEVIRSTEYEVERLARMFPTAGVLGFAEEPDCFPCKLGWRVRLLTKGVDVEVIE